MTATIELRHEHSDGSELARDKVRRFIDELGRREGIGGTWDGHRCAITGTGLKGSVQVSETEIAVVIDLALVLRPFASIIRNLIADGLTEAFDSAAPMVADAPVDSPGLDHGPDTTPDQAAGADSPNPGWVSELARGYQFGYSLDAAFYNSPTVFERDLAQVIWPQWLYVDHISRIPEPGDYFLFEVAGESIIIARGQDDRVRALFNVCTHRRSRICLQPEGNGTRLVCPYHAWGFDLDGTLVSARAMPDNFDRSTHNLARGHVAVVDGLIYISLAETPLAFDVADAILREYLRPHGLNDATVAHRERFLVRANWKLVTENFLECYHCGPAHPEYCSVNQHARGNSSGSETHLAEYQQLTEEWSQYAAALGHPTGFRDHLKPREQPVVCYRQPIRPGFKTLSQDGQPVAPLMGSFTEYDGGETVVALGPTHFISAACDHVVTFRFTPLEPNLTEVVLSWLVHGDAVAGRDYDLDKLTWMWQVTTEQDKKICEDNQAGIHSRRYRPGRYATVEIPVQRFVTEYLRMFAEPIQAHR